MSTTTKLDDFAKLAADPSNKVYVDKFDEGIRVMILRGPMALCAYLGIPIDHPLAGNSYDNLPINCHYGLTFAGAGKKDSVWSEGYYWYGWDYGHCDDLAFYDLRTGTPPDYKTESKAWLVADVERDLWQPIYELKKLMTIAENAFAKGAKWRVPESITNITEHGESAKL